MCPSFFAPLKIHKNSDVSRVRSQAFTFRPRFGVMPPTVDFTHYNAQRAEKVCWICCLIVCMPIFSQDWMYDRSNLVYTREIGEGQFGKVLLMKAKVYHT